MFEHITYSKPIILVTPQKDSKDFIAQLNFNLMYHFKLSLSDVTALSTDGKVEYWGMFVKQLELEAEATKK